MFLMEAIYTFWKNQIEIKQVKIKKLHVEYDFKLLIRSIIRRSTSAVTSKSFDNYSQGQACEIDWVQSNTAQFLPYSCRRMT